MVTNEMRTSRNRNRWPAQCEAPGCQHRFNPATNRFDLGTLRTVREDGTHYCVACCKREYEWAKASLYFCQQNADCAGHS